MVRYIGLIILTGLVGSLMVLFPLAGYSQDKVDQNKIDEAINKGTDFLLKEQQQWMKGKEIELVTLTLLHAGVDPKKNTELAKAIQELTTSKLTNTYNVALTAMALELAGWERYQSRIAECAQALVNSQCKNGQWDYPSQYESKLGQPKITGEIAKPKEIITGPGAGPSTTKAMRKIIVKRTPRGGKFGDNSNTQFALLGLRAAARCGVEIPRETWQDAAKWLEKDQLKSGGWSYSREDTGFERVPYGSMSCASLCGLVIAKFYLGQDIKKNTAIDKGLSWLGDNLTFTSNPGTVVTGSKHPKCFLYYYIYGVERVGAVLGIEQIGEHEWYPEGAAELLEEQKGDGSWNTPEDDQWSTVIADTCFAILFLKRATQKLTPKITGESK
jgi:hypothetical protein